MPKKIESNHHSEQSVFKNRALLRLLLLICISFSSVVVSAQTVFTVTSTADDGSAGTLRWAITQANASGTQSTIAFNISGTAPIVITLSNLLPPLNSTQPITIDGSTQPTNGYTGIEPKVVIKGDSLEVGDEVISTVLALNGNGGYVIKNISIQNIPVTGILIASPNNQILNNTIYGINTTEAATSGGSYIKMTSSTSNNVIQNNNLGTNFQNTLIPSSVAAVGISIGSGTGVVISNILIKDNICENSIAGIIREESGGQITYVRMTQNLLYKLGGSGGIADGPGTLYPFPNVTQYSGGIVSGTAKANDFIEVFGTPTSGQAKSYLGNTTAGADGKWSLSVGNQTWPIFIATATQNPDSVLALDNQPMTSPLGNELSNTHRCQPSVTANNVCSSQGLNLSADTVAGATYSWAGPNGFTSSAQNPVIDTAGSSTVGSYTVTVTQSGCSAITAVTIDTVACACIQLNFTVNSDTVTMESGLGFGSVSNTSSGGGNQQTFIWNFGDGSPLDTTFSLEHFYINPGTYTITLSTPADSSLCPAQSISKTITVLPVVCSADAGFQNMFTVTSTVDPAPFDSMPGTLRWAIEMANAASGHSLINFNISGAGSHTITLNSSLPSLGIPSGVTLDGSTQGGYRYGNPSIVIDGNDSISVAFFIGGGFSSSSALLKGLYIKNFTSIGVIAEGSCINIIDNVINNIIGTNEYNGVTADIYGGDLEFSTIKGNILGTDSAGTNYTITNSEYGIYIISGSGLSDFDIFGDTTVTGKNIIAYHDSAGIFLAGVAGGEFGVVAGDIPMVHAVRMSGNEIYNNKEAIQLQADANLYKTKPIINTITDLTHVTGTSNPGDIIELFGSTGPQNANQYLTTVVADTGGHWMSDLCALPSFVASQWHYISATATNAGLNTSELAISNTFSLSCPCTTHLNFTLSPDTISISGAGVAFAEFNNTSTGFSENQSFIWNAGGGLISGFSLIDTTSESNLFAYYINAGTYTITLSVPSDSSASCPIQSVSKTITVLAPVCNADTSAQYIFTVTKTTDPDPFLCGSGDSILTCTDTTMHGTLQWAVRMANAINGTSKIVFNIPGAAPHTIRLNYELPLILGQTFIDASTQPGYQYGNPAVIIDGHDSIAQAFFLVFSQSLLKGVYIKNFTSAGVIAAGNCVQIIDNVINRNFSASVSSGFGVTADILGEDLNFSTIKGNILGTDINNTNFSNENSSYGIYVLSGSGLSGNDIIGDTSTTGKNIIAYHDSSGVFLLGDVGFVLGNIPGAEYIRISGNEIYSNLEKAINLNTGANNFKTIPVINTITDLTHVTGTSNPGDIIELFGSTGPQNANQYLTTVITDTGGHWMSDLCALPSFLASQWHYISATATDKANNTSELAISNIFNLNCLNIDFTFSNGAAGDTITFTNNSTGGGGPPPPGGHFTWTFCGSGGCDTVPSTNVKHPFPVPGTYTVTLCFFNPGLITCTTHTISIPPPEPPFSCATCIGSFAPEPGKYLISAWVMEENASPTKLSYTFPQIIIQFPTDTTLTNFSSPPLGPFIAQGAIIDGWQRIEAEFVVPVTATFINLKLVSGSGNCYFDDIRIFPFDGSMKSYVYDPVNLRLVAELDERNYATLYEYDEEGKLIRVKKETENGVMTIKENRNSSVKQ